MTLVVRCYDREKALHVLERCTDSFVTPCEAPNALNLHIPDIGELHIDTKESVLVVTDSCYGFRLNYKDYLSLEIQ